MDPMGMKPIKSTRKTRKPRIHQAKPENLTLVRYGGTIKKDALKAKCRDRMISR